MSYSKASDFRISNVSVVGVGRAHHHGDVGLPLKDLVQGATCALIRPVSKHMLEVTQ